MQIKYENDLFIIKTDTENENPDLAKMIYLYVKETRTEITINEETGKETSTEVPFEKLLYRIKIAKVEDQEQVVNRIFSIASSYREQLENPEPALDEDPVEEVTAVIDAFDVAAYLRE